MNACIEIVIEKAFDILKEKYFNNVLIENNWEILFKNFTHVKKDEILERASEVDNDFMAKIAQKIDDGKTINMLDTCTFLKLYQLKKEGVI